MYTAKSGHAAGPWRKLVVAFVLSLLVFHLISRRSDIVQSRMWQVSTNEISIDEPAPMDNSSLPLESAPDACYGFPDTDDILLILKTGATEVYEKLPIHFVTTLKCINDSMLLSDMEMDIADRHVDNVLSDFPEDLQHDNEDFALYKQLQEFSRSQQDLSSLKAQNNGWNLDKYKFIPMMQKTWEYRQDAKWYFFSEADTAINWNNLRAYLDTLDSTKPYYVGSPAFLGETRFAHGGTGYAISNAAMQKIVGQHPNIGDEYNKEVRDMCCGDAIVAKIMLDKHIGLTNAWPMFNGETPFSTPYGVRQWCQPFITMHHMTSQEISEVWDFSQQWQVDGNKTPILWKDIFNHFVEQSLEPRRADWDNMSGDKVFSKKAENQRGGRKWSEYTPAERLAVKSPEKCEALCIKSQDCFQWRYQNGDCGLARDFKLGKPKTTGGDNKYTSGWRFDRIGAFRQKMGDCRNGPVWTSDEPSLDQSKPVDERST